MLIVLTYMTTQSQYLDLSSCSNLKVDTKNRFITCFRL